MRTYRERLTVYALATKVGLTIVDVGAAFDIFQNIDTDLNKLITVSSFDEVAQIVFNRAELEIENIQYFMWKADEWRHAA
jgi:hypothetical protein